ncbi:lysine-specific demethylase 8 isoform X2 [Exaiptasia diaphana]|nr:lysine-specific demethylase 8 isoform X2 [Exaiptasia diaphana]XP_028514593.1 lysine-specific demethylase 8 isoform X2 [Exaiptasia diaphana]XP_028514594.1 lysine-specific demethylase 8 isoform X2 [Exaiptasia diaphana]XP_028514595.1 lysine-specific demethylase 8 isoform X2 [Exaiptasia diaphana]
MAQRTADQPGCVGIHMALASYYLKMKDLTKAEEYLDNASKLDPGNSEVLWLQAKIRKDKSLEQQTKKCKEKFVPPKQGKLKMKDPFKVERCAFPTLTPQEFLLQYAVTGKPVIITGLVQHMTSSPWNIQYIKKVIGHNIIPTRQQSQESRTVAHIIDSLHNNRKSSCSYGWTMTSIGSDLTKDLCIPRYVADDFLQRTNTAYRDSWPCLYIESVGLTEHMQMEPFGLNCWIALFEGRKRFTFVRKEDMPCLYPYCNDNLDIAFYANINKPDLQDFPLLSTFTPLECILEPGEFLFIPSGTAYSSEALDDCLVLSGNYVDLSNIDCVKEELNAMKLSNLNIKELFEQLSSEAFPSKMWSCQNDLKWKEYKHWPRENYQMFDITQSDCL